MPATVKTVTHSGPLKLVSGLLTTMHALAGETRRRRGRNRGHDTDAEISRGHASNSLFSHCRDSGHASVVVEECHNRLTCRKTACSRKQPWSSFGNQRESLLVTHQRAGTLDRNSPAYTVARFCATGICPSNVIRSSWRPLARRNKGVRKSSKTHELICEFSLVLVVEHSAQPRTLLVSACLPTWAAQFVPGTQGVSHVQPSETLKHHWIIPSRVQKISI